MKCRRELIDKVVADHSPRGMEKLALESEVSASTIEKARLGIIPKKEGTRLKLCRGVSKLLRTRVTEEMLFSSGEADEEEAS